MELLFFIDPKHCLYKNNDARIENERQSRNDTCFRNISSVSVPIGSIKCYRVDEDEGLFVDHCN